MGGVGALAFVMMSYLFSAQIALLLSMFTTVYLTGAFHEDGFADVCDGFGGGWTKDKILFIMKDSCVGAYGLIGIFFLMTIKFFALFELTLLNMPLVLISGHSLSRCMGAIIVYWLPYVSVSQDSKSRVVASKAKDSVLLVLNIFFGIMPLFFFQNSLFLLSILPTFLAMLFLASKYRRWIGGQTGDCAGATQQFCEVIFYLSLLVIWKFI